MANLDLHVTSVDVGGKLWHTIRFADGSWQPFFGNVNAQESNDPGSLYAVDCTSDVDDLHVIATTDVNNARNGGKLWHTIRFADGSWQRRFEDVDTRVPGVPGAFFGVGCAVVDNGDLHVITLTH